MSLIHLTSEGKVLIQGIKRPKLFVKNENSANEV